MNKKIVCPECGKQLSLNVKIISSRARKIKKDGSLHNSTSQKNREKTDVYFLECNNYECGFVYHLTYQENSQDRYEYLDEWYEELNDDIEL